MYPTLLASAVSKSPASACWSHRRTRRPLDFRPRTGAQRPARIGEQCRGGRRARRPRRREAAVDARAPARGAVFLAGIEPRRYELVRRPAWRRGGGSVRHAPSAAADLRVLAAATPALAVGHAIGRIGCFLVGDDYGRPSNLPWAVAFPKGLPPTETCTRPSSTRPRRWWWWRCCCCAGGETGSPTKPCSAATSCSPARSGSPSNSCASTYASSARFRWRIWSPPLCSLPARCCYPCASRPVLHRNIGKCCARMQLHRDNSGDIRID